MAGAYREGSEQVNNGRAVTPNERARLRELVQECSAGNVFLALADAINGMEDYALDEGEVDVMRAIWNYL